MLNEDYSANTLTEAAIALHEFYLSLITAGFDEDQAMYLVGAVVQTQAAGVGGDYEL
jgi:hypothetical protein